MRGGFGMTNPAIAAGPGKCPWAGWMKKEQGNTRAVVGNGSLAGI